MTSRALLTGLLAAVAAAALGGGARADPSARVGRIAITQGGVSLLTPGTDTWAWASRNYPVAPGESFWTGDDGRTELQLGAVDTRLDSQTELDVLDLDYGEMRLALPQGSIDVRLWSNPRGGVTVATPAGDVRLDRQGLYRVDVGPPAADGGYPVVEVTVFEGWAWAPSPEGPQGVGAGQAAVLYAGYDPQYQTPQDASIDDWGRDVEARARWRPTDDASAAIPGLADLDAAGDYIDDPQFGRVWFPRDVPPGWAPYRYGRWAYVEPWGYTWIDDAPWGFAPFHYGRWAQFGGRWGWIRGRTTAEPVYAPALVTFLGGVGWSLGGSDAIGWAPLAPDEIYRPNYAVSDGYWRRMNAASVRPTIINSVTINTVPINVYRNATAATVVRTGDFSSGQSVHRAAIPVTADVIARAPIATPSSRPPPTPTARTGPSRPAGAQAGAPTTASRPPVALRAVRAAVAAPTTRSGAPPVIAGAHLAPPASRRGPGAPPVGPVAPAQRAHPSPAGAAPAPAHAAPPQPQPVHATASPSAVTSPPARPTPSNAAGPSSMAPSSMTPSSMAHGPASPRPASSSPAGPRPLIASPTTGKPPAPAAADQEPREGGRAREAAPTQPRPATSAPPVKPHTVAPESAAPETARPQAFGPRATVPTAERPPAERPQTARSETARPEPRRPEGPAVAPAKPPSPPATSRGTPPAAPAAPPAAHRQRPEPGDPRRPEEAGSPRP